VKLNGFPLKSALAASYVVAAMTSFGAVSAHADSTVTILHTNDFHSRVEPISKYDSPCSAEDNAEGKCFGGYARLVTAVAEARSRNPDALLFDGGDQFQGSLFYTYPEDTGELASPGKNVSFSDPVAAVQGEVDELTAQGINKIIVLSHSGYAVDKRVAGMTTGVDVIIGGHTNTFLSNISDRAVGPYPTMVGDTAIVQAYAYGKYIGELSVTFNDAGEVVSASGEPITIDGEVSEQEDIVARVAELAKPLDEIRNKVVASSAAVIEGNRAVCRIQECEMGNLVADAMLDRVKDQGVTIAIMNSGGLRSSIDAGDVTMGEVLTVLPFQNTLSTFDISGADVIAALENGVSQVEEVKGRFPQVAGLKFKWDPSVAPNEGRVTEVMVDMGGEYKAIDPAATYSVVSNNYVRGGGDGYKMFATNAQNAYDFGPNMEDVLAEYLAANAPYAPKVEGRISQ